MYGRTLTVGGDWPRSTSWEAARSKSSASSAALPLDTELGNTEWRAGWVDDARADDFAPRLDEDLCVAVIEANLAADDVARSEGGHCQQIRELGQLREIDARRGRQYLDDASAAPVQRNGQHVDGVADEVAVRIGDADEQRPGVGRG
jgi:hypothetical protein